MPRHNPVVQPVGLQHVVGWWSHLPHPKRRIIPLTSRCFTHQGSQWTWQWSIILHHSENVDFFPTKMVKLHIRRKKNQSSFERSVVRYQSTAGACFTFNKKTPSTGPPLQGKMDEKRECHQLQVEIHKIHGFSRCFAWNPRHCCAPNASWVSILSTASPAACRGWYILWNLWPLQHLHQKDHLLHDYVFHRFFCWKMMEKMCVFLETREEIYGKFTWEPPIFTAKSTPSHDFWPIRLVLHQVYEGPRVLRWPGVLGNCSSRLEVEKTTITG